MIKITIDHYIEDIEAMLENATKHELCDECTEKAVKYIEKTSMRNQPDLFDCYFTTLCYKHYFLYHLKGK
jgi:hypothetical protein